MELLQGAKNKHEKKQIKRKLSSFWLLPMQNDIAKLSSELIDMFTLSHNLSIPDSIIAATALSFQLPLISNNIKDFRYIPELILWSL